MKRLFVLMMCAMLAVPSVGMNAQATSAPMQRVTNAEVVMPNLWGNPKDRAIEKLSALGLGVEVYEEYSTEAEGRVFKTIPEADEKMKEGTMVQIYISKGSKASGSDGLGSAESESASPTNIKKKSTETEKQKADAAAEDSAIFINKHYTAQKFNDEEKTAAKKIMEEAANQLGLKLNSLGKLETDSVETKFETKKAVEEYVKKIMTELTACKTSVEEPESPPTPSTPSEPEKIDVNSTIIIGGKEYDTTTANAGQYCEIAVPLVNLGETDVENVVITPVLSSDVTVWPFDIEKTDYSQVCEELEAGSDDTVLKRKHTFRWTLRTRDDAVTGYTKLTFNVTYNEADGSKGSVALDYYVNVNGVEPEETNGKLSTPRVIVTGFTTTPEEVYAGDTFKLTLNLKNTSKETAVQNMLFDIQGTQEGTDANNTYAAFLPTAGSSTIFVDSIAANSTKSISIELKSKADLAQKPYVVTVNMEYEDSKANPFTETASVSVPIKQEAKVDLSSIQVMPEAIEIGREANVMFSIYNVGKTKLYNVNVKFVADSISGGETFIGNMDPGATGNVDAYLVGQTMTADDGTVKILIAYEDEEGKESVIEKTMTLFVNEPFYPEMYDDPMMEGMVEEQKSFPWWGYAIIGAAVVGGAAAAVLVVKKKKKAKKLAEEEMELINSLEDNE